MSDARTGVGTGLECNYFHYTKYSVNVRAEQRSLADYLHVVVLRVFRVVRLAILEISTHGEARLAEHPQFLDRPRLRCLRPPRIQRNRTLDEIDAN